MLVKLLNGELVELAEVESTQTPENEIARILDVFPSQIRFIPSAPYSLVFVDTLPTILLENDNHLFDLSFLRTCKNTDILSYFIQMLPVFHTARYQISMNPHPQVVEYLLSTSNTTLEDSASGNPSDQILDMLFQQPEKIHLGFMCYNSNPRALDYVLTSLTTNEMSLQSLHTHEWDALGSHPYLPTIQFVLGRFLENVRHPCHSLLRNNHPYVIDWIMNHQDDLPKPELYGAAAVSENAQMIQLYTQLLESTSGEDVPTNHLFVRNPHDCAVDWLLAHPHIIRAHLQYACINSNPRMVNFLIKQFFEKFENLDYFIPIFMMNSDMSASLFGIEYTKQQKLVNADVYSRAMMIGAKSVRREVLLLWLNEWKHIPSRCEQMMKALSRFEDINVVIK